MPRPALQRQVADMVRYISRPRKKVDLVIVDLKCSRESGAVALSHCKGPMQDAFAHLGTAVIGGRRQLCSLQAWELVTSNGYEVWAPVKHRIQASKGQKSENEES